MWDLTVDWTEIIIRSAVIFIFLFVLFRFLGKKHISKLTPFDFILLLIMSECVQNALVKDDKSVSAALISISTLVSLNVLLNKITFKSKKAEELIDGIPKVLIKDGHLYKELMRQETITDKELHEALRIGGVLDIKDVYLAMLETNGSISVIKKSEIN